MQRAGFRGPRAVRSDSRKDETISPFRNGIGPIVTGREVIFRDLEVLMFKKMMMVFAMTLALATMVSASTTTQQNPLPCSGCGATGSGT